MLDIYDKITLALMAIWFAVALVVNPLLAATGYPVLPWWVDTLVAVSILAMALGYALDLEFI